MKRSESAKVSARRADAKFAADEKGIAAVEFALILPVMLLIYLGLVELSRGVRAARQVDLVAHMVADLTGQTPQNGSSAAQLSDAYLNAVFSSGSAMLIPLPAGSLKITVSEINIQLNSGNYYATVDWSFSFNGGSLRDKVNTSGCAGALKTPPTLGTYLQASDADPPISLNSLPSRYTSLTSNPTAGPIIVADVSYIYTPAVSLGASMFGNGAFGKLFVNGGFTMQRTAYGTIRNQYTGLAPLYNHIQYPSSTALTGINCIAPTL